MAFVPIRGLSKLSEIQDAAKLAQYATKLPGVGLDMPQDALNKLKWMASAKEHRDFREVNDVLLKKMGAAFTKALFRVMKKKAPITEPWKAAGEAYQDHLVFRLSHSGGDVKMKPLKPATIERKGSSQIGRDTGDLYRDVRAAKVRLTK